MQIRQIIFSAPDRVEFRNFSHDGNGLRPDQIMVTTEYSIVSAATELAILNGKTEAWAQLPYVPGYGAVGTVTGIGSAVENRKIGERLFFWGKHQSHATLGTDFMVAVPMELDSRLAVLARMAQISYTALRVSTATLGDFVAVFGLGLVGNLAAQLFHLSGCTVIGLDISSGRLAVAHSCGIDHVIDTREGDFVRTIRDISGGEMCNTVVDATGIPDVAAGAMAAARKGGELVLLGTPRGIYSADATQILRAVHIADHNIRMIGAHEWTLPVMHNPFARHSIERNVKQFMALALSRKLHIPEIISHCLAPSACSDVYANLRNRNEDYLGVIFDWTAPG